jgi:hypothetical protein
MIPLSRASWRKDAASSQFRPRFVSSCVPVSFQAASPFRFNRVIRFVPSLAPPLWWTIPGNLAIPGSGKGDISLSGKRQPAQHDRRRHCPDADGRSHAQLFVPIPGDGPQIDTSADHAVEQPIPSLLIHDVERAFLESAGTRREAGSQQMAVPKLCSAPDPTTSGNRGTRLSRFEPPPVPSPDAASRRSPQRDSIRPTAAPSTTAASPATTLPRT